MKINFLSLFSLTATLAIPAPGLASDLPPPELINAHGESYVNLQLCSNTYLEYRNRPRVAKQFLDASLRIRAAYTTDEQLDAFIDAIQKTHDQQGSIEVYEDESRGGFYQRVFSEERCEQELKTAEAYQWPLMDRTPASTDSP